MSSTLADTTLGTTHSQEPHPLRRRMHLLHRAHSLSNVGSTTGRKTLPGLPSMKHDKSSRKDEDRSDNDNSSPLEYETGMESSEEEKDARKGPPKQAVSSKSKPQRAPVSSQTKAPPVRPRVNTASLNTAPSSHSHWRKEASPMSPTSRSWYEFDLAVVVALVSPIGNWLTGGDHIKNLLLIVLLIFYLHQIIEVPWSLYRKARPRRRSPQFPPSPSDGAEARYAHLAAIELHRLELFFLFLTLISPLCGAFLLRYATAAVLGPDAVSWFSTGLFVLATGMRPWAHLVDRLNERTSELHDFIHYPEVVTAQAKPEPSQELEKRIAKLEKSLSKVKAQVVRATDDVYDYVDDAVEFLQGDLRDQENRQDEKMSHIEQSVCKIGQQTRRGIGSFLSQTFVPGWLFSTIWPFSSLKETFGHKKVHHTAKVVSSPVPSTSSSPKSPLPRSTTLLDDIDEEEVVYESYPSLIRPAVYASRMVSRLISIAVLPFNAAVRMMFGRY